MSANEGLTYEPAACWRRLQATKSEFFFEDLDGLMKERYAQFLEELMGYERQSFINAHPYQRASRVVSTRPTAFTSGTSLPGSECWP